MIFFIYGLATLIILFYLIRYITSIDSERFQSLIKFFVGIIFLIIAVFLLFRGFYYISGPLLAISLWLTRLKTILGLYNSFSKNKKNEIYLDKNEALDILGLDFNATKDDIIAAHKKLIEKNHPDKGGSDYLSAKINKARDVLLKDK